ncbi:MAG: aspartate aminotransferase family protein [Clostridia bacterium]|nr:aspartate aminotransferase family protein [Clostridia bacterium]
MNIKEADKQYIMPTYGRFDLCIVKGEGSTYYDENGKKYIDMGTGIAVNTFGANDEEWKNAVIEQIGKIQHTSNLYYSEPCVKLAKILCEKTGLKKVFFGNSGAEANECAIKGARKYGTDIREDKNVIITLKDSFHGRTITTLSATGQDVFHKNFTPFTEGFVHVTANDIDELKSAINDKVCAIMIEIVQGEGGVNTLDKEYLDEIEKITTENDILLVVDEVQTGNGRTGSMYAFMQFGLTPDIVSTAKGLAGGLPMGATMFGERVENVLPAGTHGSTFGGNPVCANAAISVVSRIDDKLMDTVKANSKYLVEKLLKIKGVKSVSGLGYMLGIEIDGDAKAVASKCIENGLLVLTAKTKIRLLPALNITREEIDNALEIFEKVLNELQ